MTLPVAQLAAVRSQATGVEDAALHRAILQRTVRGERVLMFRDDHALAHALRSAGCEVMVKSAGALPAGRLDALREFDPDLVIAADVLAEVQAGAVLLREIAGAAPRARLFACFWNASSAERLVALLSGQSPSTLAIPDDEFRSWAEAAGYNAVHREALPVPAVEGPYPPDLQRRLLSLFRQVNASARADRVFYVLSRTVQPVETPNPPHVDGLLSVIMRNHTLERLGLLDHAVFSLACQRYQPLEIVVASQCRDVRTVEAIEEVLRLHQRIGGYTFRVVQEPSAKDIRSRLLNLGLQAGRGRYVAFLDDDDLVYPTHYQQLIAALRSGTDAWAFARARRAFFSRRPSGELYCVAKRDVFERNAYDRAALFDDNYITSHSYVLDRQRLGTFPLQFADEFVQLEDYVLLLQLAALFKPTFVCGPATCEYRIRDDGSNTVPESAVPGEAEAVRTNWDLARAQKNIVAGKVHAVVTVDEIARDVRAARSSGPVAAAARPASAPEEMRYRIADQVNGALKRILPVHSLLRSAAARLLGAARKP